jgi:hypothetical protein
MPSELNVFNPSPFPRTGYVTVDWQPIYEKFRIEPERLVLLDASGKPVPSQVDAIDPSTLSRAALSFLPNHSIDPMSDDYRIPSTSLLLTEGTPSEADNEDAPGVDVQGSFVVLHNRKLVVKFNLTPELEGDPRTAHAVYAGAATSVQLDLLEHLDAFNAFNVNRMLSHDPEKRCMQIDHIQLTNPAWEQAPFAQISFHDRSYRVVDSSSGPVRASVTVASEPFYYPSSYRRGRSVRCELYRVLSLYRDADFVMDELFINTPEPDLQLNFTAQYFSYMDIGLPFIAHYEDVPDWFVLAFPYSPFHGYGFATDVHVHRIAHPHPGFPLADQSNKSFSWQLFRSGRARSIHIFMRLGLRDLESHDMGAVKYEFTHHVGHSWYEHIFKPLLARIPNEGEANAK